MLVDEPLEAIKVYACAAYLDIADGDDVYGGSLDVDAQELDGAPPKNYCSTW